jgi:beta-glucosidase
MKNRTYRYFTGKPEYAFGHGLSYTSFSYSTPTYSTHRVAAGKDQLVKVRVRNVGKIAGDEVAQLYIATPGVKGTPLKSLKGYQRVHLSAGETKTLTFRLTPRDMAFADAKGVMRILPATYQLWIGGGQQGTGAPGTAGQFQVEGTLALPR